MWWESSRWVVGSVKWRHGLVCIMVSDAKIGQTDSECRTERWCREPLSPKWIPIDLLVSLRNQLRVWSLCICCLSQQSSVHWEYSVPLFVCQAIHGDVRLLAVTMPVRDVWHLRHHLCADLRQDLKHCLCVDLRQDLRHHLYIDLRKYLRHHLYVDWGRTWDTAFMLVWGRNWGTAYM